MSLKTKIAALSTLLMLQNFSAANAAAIDNEVAVFAAEQDRTGESVEVFDPESVDADKKKTKTKDEIKAEEKRLEREREEARKKIKEERKKSRDELKGKTPISKNPAPVARTTNNNPTATTQKKISSNNKTPAIKESPAVTEKTETTKTPAATEKPAITKKPAVVKKDVTENPPVEKPVETPPPVEEQKPIQPPQNVSLANPIVNYASFNEIVQALQFTPLYIPKKSGYDIVSIMSIDNVAEIRYRRKWEPNVLLHVRTYRRAEGEELKDISGVHGVKWRVHAANGITTYLAKIEENKHVAAWAVGRYTFSAYVENLSFAAFHSLVADELVDLSQHYYLGY